MKREPSRKGPALVWARRIVQGLSLALFVYLVLSTVYRMRLQDAADMTGLPHPVALYLEADPLAALTVALSTHRVPSSMALALVITVLTILLGRLFCGWICPLGIMNHMVGARQRRVSYSERVERNRYHPYQGIKYVILVALLTASVLSSVQSGLLDPLCLAFRSVAFVIIPGLNVLIRGVAQGLYDSDIGAVRAVGDGILYLFSDTVLSFKQIFVQGSLIFALLFGLILVANSSISRLWCRALCPLGALLGVLSRFSLLGLGKREDLCIHCHKCTQSCPAGASPEGGERWRASECYLCFNCEGVCPTGALSFGFFPERASLTISTDVSRRRLLASVALAAATVPVLRSSQTVAASDPRRIRPPGALSEEEFIKRCIKCGACIKVCPNNALQPALGEGGWEGLWSPVLVPRIGYCEPSCVLCSTVCPTGAIGPLSVAEKVGREGHPPIRLGTAFYDRGRCLPWAMGVPCIVCEEFCPTSPKAIRLERSLVKNPQGGTIEVQRPYIVPALCVGCGVCEHVCPVSNSPAVYVSAVGESREKGRGILLTEP